MDVRVIILKRINAFSKKKILLVLSLLLVTLSNNYISGNTTHHNGTLEHCKRYRTTDNLELDTCVEMHQRHKHHVHNDNN